jgi:membrane fusion protein (multidrug efflux system)
MITAGILDRHQLGLARRRVWRLHTLGLAVWVCLATLVVTMGCQKQEPKPSAAPPPPEVLVATVLQKDTVIPLEWIGVTEGFVNAEIRPRVSGYVLTQRYTEGDRVKKGQVLFEIDARESQASFAQARARLAGSKVQLTRSQQDVTRYTPLAAQKAVSQQELDTVVAALNNATADVEFAQAAFEQAELTLQWTKVTSPIDGVAGVAVQQVGALVSEQTIMTTVSTLDPIKVSFNITEDEYLRSAKAMLAARGKVEPSTLELLLRDGSLYPYTGKPMFVDREVDARTGTIAIKASFPNPGNLLRPGQYAKIRTTGKTKRAALLVPERAILEAQGTFTVGVVSGDNSVEFRAVKLAERVGSLRIIEQGLNPGERIVVDGMERIRPGMTVVPKPAPPIADTAASPVTTGE